MLPTWKTLLLRNLLLIAAIESIGLPKAGCALFGLNIPILSDLLNGKLTMIFNTFDFNGDGIISREEYIGKVEKFAEMENFDPQEKDAALKCFSDLFAFYISAAGGNNVPLTVNLFTASVKMQKDNPEFKQSIYAAMLSIVTPMNLQEPGYLNYNEYNRLFENVGLVNVVFTKGAFGLIDADGDGKVSVAQICDTMVVFMTTDNNLFASLLGLLG